MANPDTTPPNLTYHQILNFWASISRRPGQGPKGDCWEWQRGCVNGYGWFTPYHRGRSYRANRLAFFFANFRWPNKLALHVCDNPPCCRPDHLFEGNSQDNALDAQQKGRLAFGDKNGMRLHPEKVTRGSNHKLAKLTDQDVIEIRSLHKTGKFMHKTLAGKFKVSRSLIGLIVRRKTWRHI